MAESMKSRQRAERESSGQSDVSRLRNRLGLYRFGFYIFLALSVALFALCFYLGTLPKSEPWVIEISSDGEAQYYPDAVKLLSDWTPSEATTRYFLRKYITNLREVSLDNQRNNEQIVGLFATSVGSAIQEMQSYLTENNPFLRSANETVELPENEISIVRYDSVRWQVTWREQTKRPDGTLKADEQYQGIFAVSFYAPNTEEERLSNPIGLYISDFSISRLRSLM